MFSLKKWWTNLLKHRKEIEQKRRQVTLNNQLRQSFRNKNLSAMARALELGGDPNLPQTFHKHPCQSLDIFDFGTEKDEVQRLFSKRSFQLTYLDIIKNTNFFASPDRQKVYSLLERYGGQATEEGDRAFAYWKDVETVVEDKETPKEFFCRMAMTCQQLERTTRVGGLWPYHIELPEKCCPHWDCPNRDRSTFGMYYTRGRWWRERY